jgi:hypothetical protein
MSSTAGHLREPSDAISMAVDLLKTKCAAAMEADCALHLMN